ncbi:Tetratricopeptide repeat-containing protein [Filimonas lacunae]|uniref:Tetratricopeptide repeat-containing protein n=2 Tax=Filimonas lacunae TaxID=477680 RepID=A0A173MCC9_9BACT|nr:TPR domain protein [Filimonas lacunae]SIT22480.1 Tetratricopeptide repeat-containing protein [Filimonas lacunae]
MNYGLSIAVAGITLFASCKDKSNNNDKDTATSSRKELSPEAQSLVSLLKLRPDSAGLRLKLAVMYDSAAWYPEALAQMDSLIKKDSLNYGLWYSKAQVWEHSGDTARAIKDYERALHIYPAPEAMLSLASLMAENKNPQTLAVIDNVNHMRLGREYDAHCAFISGVYYARTGDTTNAIKQLNNCLAANYTYMEAYIEKGLVYFDHQQYDKALDVFKFASSINTLYADAYYYQARAYEMMNKKDSAVLRFKQALSLDKGMKEAREKIQQLEK